jgi:hypothetical protein
MLEIEASHIDLPGILQFDCDSYFGAVAAIAGKAPASVGHRVPQVTQQLTKRFARRSEGLIPCRPTLLHQVRHPEVFMREVSTFHEREYYQSKQGIARLGYNMNVLSGKFSSDEIQILQSADCKPARFAP